MALYRQFIVCQFVPDLERPGKTHKFPVDYRTRRITTKGNGGAHDPEIWIDAATACTIATEMGTTPDVNGIHYGVGFTFTEQDPFFFVDMDDCLGTDGTYTPIVYELCAQLQGAAVEISHSGRGLHIIGTGTAPIHRRIKDVTNKLFDLYTEKRFVALTGTNIIGNVLSTHTLALQAITDKWLKLENSSTKPQTWTTEGCEGYYCTDSDERLIERALMSFNKTGDIGHVRATFADLWNRDIDRLAHAFPPDPNNPSDPYNASSADSALAMQLAFWTGSNCEHIKRLMFLSGLVREKWERDGYIDTTILKACAVHSGGHLTDKPLVAEKQTGMFRLPVKRGDSTFINADGLLTVFAGCTYVRDHHGVLLPDGDIVDQARFKAHFAGKRYCMDATNDKTTTDPWSAFLENEAIAFPHVEGTCFRPDLPFQSVTNWEGRDCINMYRKPVVKRTVGDVTPFLNLLKKLLPNDDDALILLSYLAAVIQYPGKKFRWAVFLQGTEGNGKSLIVKCLRRALGDKYIFNVKAPMIANGFNAWMENHLLYVADDIYTLKDRAELLEVLKNLITDPDQPITYKGIDSKQKQTCGNWLFTDNHRDGLSITEDTRRICTLYCAQQNKRKRISDGLDEYFFSDEFVPWLESGGYEFITEYLHTVPIDPRYNPGGRCQVAPRTSATREAIEDGRTGVEHDIQEWIELGEPGFCGGFVSVSMLKRHLDKPMSALKIKETLGRLGYEIHPSLPGGRATIEVTPDGTRPILYVKAGSLPAEVLNPVLVANLYAAAQNMALSRNLIGAQQT